MSRVIISVISLHDKLMKKLVDDTLSLLMTDFFE